MKLFLVAFLCVIRSVSAQYSEVRTPGSFTGVKVSEGIDLYLKKGYREGVKIETEGLSPESVITEISGDYLKIYLTPGNYRKVKVKAWVTYVQLSQLSASAAARINSAEPIRAKLIKINASSDATIDLPVEADEAEVHVSSAADVELSGKVGKLTAEISSAGTLDALNFNAEAVKIEVSSAGSASIHAANDLEAKAVSAGSIRYKGNPVRSVTHSSSAGTIKKLEQ